jgi:hypothetical protein
MIAPAANTDISIFFMRRSPFLSARPGYLRNLPLNALHFHLHAIAKMTAIAFTSR